MKRASDALACDRRVKCDPSSRYYVRFDYFSGTEAENVAEMIFSISQHTAFKKGIRLCSSRPTRPPIDACGCLPFSGVFRHREAASIAVFFFRTSFALARALLALRA